MTMDYTAPGAAAAPAAERPTRTGSHEDQRRSRADTPTVREHAPRWERPALIGLLVATAVLYLVDLGASGWANSFYSAAVQAGSVSWKAFLFGSSDAGNSITVDKPPASLWVMALSVRIFGLSSWSILVPQALMGVGTVGVLYAAVRRHFSAGIALLGGAVLALTPVAALMFRFNNPDALLVLLMTASVYVVVRAVQDGRTRWLVAAGALVGLGFLTKQLQVFLVVPALSLAYLVAGPRRILTRIVQLLAAGVAIVVSAGWWVALVELWPASSRPYIGGSTDNSFWDLTFGYNGFGRLTGNETGSVGGGAAGTSGRWGATGITRLFTAEFGGQITWLVPAALILGVAALVLLRRRGRLDGQRAQVVLWLTWLVVTAVTFSFMSGIFHAYYTVALAPAVAGLLAVGVGVAWRERAGVPAVASLAVASLAAATLVTAIWSSVLLARSATFVPWLHWLVLVAGLLAAAALAATLVRPLSPALTTAAASVAVAASLAGPAAYTLQTVSTAHTGSIVSAGPTVAGATGFGGFGGRPGGAAGGGVPGGMTRTPGGAFPGGGGRTPGGTGQGRTFGWQGGAGAQGGRAGGRAGGMGGLLNATTPSAALTKLLETDAGSYTWVAATVGANNASGYQLATQDAVMPIGGFNGTDASPTLAQFQADVSAGKIHYFIASGGGFGGGFGGGSSTEGTASAITSWVEQSFTAQTVAGTTVYDLSTAASAASA